MTEGGIHTPGIRADIVYEVAGIPITNTLITTWAVMIIIIVLAYLGTRNIRSIPKGMQNLWELIIEKLFDFFNSVWQDRKKTRKYFSILATFFILIVGANWIGLLIEAVPGINKIGIEKINHGEIEFVHMFRSANSDLNMTLSWAIISVLLVQVFGILALGFKEYGKKFFNFKNPIYTFVGLLELVSEFAKVISFSFRLFGNILAGEVLLVAVTQLAAFLAPIPFYGLEIFVGFIQGLVFTILSLVFMKLAMQAHH